jgi:hypothetical protein
MRGEEVRVARPGRGLAEAATLDDGEQGREVLLPLLPLPCCPARPRHRLARCELERVGNTGRESLRCQRVARERGIADA